MANDDRRQASFDEQMMARCIELALCGAEGAAPNPMVGALLAVDGRIVGEGFHRQWGGPHAEVHAIRSVADRSLLRRSTLYVTLEPCAHFGKTPPCADLIVSEGIPRVVVGCRDPFAKVNGAGIRRMRDAGIEVTVGVLEKECRYLNRRFITFHSLRRPWVTLKWAQSADGFIDRERSGGAPQRFSSAFTQALAHRERAMHQAILVGTRTAVLDNPTLTTRHWDGPNPLRLTIDRHGVLPDNLNMMDDAAPFHVYRDGAPEAVLADLYARGIQSLLVEGGARTLQSFIDSGLWDEVRVETAPMTLGSGVAAPQLHSAQSVALQFLDGRRLETFAPMEGYEVRFRNSEGA